MKTVMFNPYTGTPRHPSDIASDPEGLLIVESGAPLRAALNTARNDELRAAQELDEATAILRTFADLCAEFCDHTPDSFNRQVMRLGNAARLLLNARKPWSSDLGPNVGAKLETTAPAKN